MTLVSRKQLTTTNAGGGAGGAVATATIKAPLSGAASCSSSSGGNLNTSSNHRFHRNGGSNNNNNHANISSNSTGKKSSNKGLLVVVAVGVGILLLFTAYIRLAVHVAKQQQQQQQQPVQVASTPAAAAAKTDTDSRKDDIAAAVVVEEKQKEQPPPQEQQQQQQQQQNQQQQQIPEEEKKNAAEFSPFRKWHLENPLHHGVQPDVLIPHYDPNDSLQNQRHQQDQQQQQQHPTPDFVLTAYLEAPNMEEWEMKPLPIRSKAQKDLLQTVSYPRVRSCQHLLEQFPVDDTPTDADPFLPWIHDVFPTADGRYIQFIAQNKRRCKTGSTAAEKGIFYAMQPQIALFQHVSVKRVPTEEEEVEPRFQLTSHEQADLDGMATRFLCRFKPTNDITLSVYNFDYDWTSSRKGYSKGFQKDVSDNKFVHTAQLLFRCPVPRHLQEGIRTGAAVQDDWATLFVDLIPIRTPPRYTSPRQYLQPKYAEFQDETVVFDAAVEWGDSHILPRIQNAGRWENIPICKPSLLQYEKEEYAEPVAASIDIVDSNNNNYKKEAPIQKKHNLVSCIWASAGYTTRGNRFAVNDGQRRLLEWITYNKLIGFDHFYLYDNTGAYQKQLNDSSVIVTTLKPIADLFPNEITYIPWPATVCNNNPNNVDSIGERSSQYAAEASCLHRFGPHVNWIGQFDIDEYFVPMGSYTSALQLLDKLDQENTKIIAFASWRAWPRWEFINPIEPIHDPHVCWSPEPCFHLTIPRNITMLQAYNCDRQPPGKKSSTMPAEKQFYRPDYVLQHFIHYSAVTVLSEKNSSEWAAEGIPWRGRAFPDPRQRFGNEITEGLMIHTKAVAVQDTIAWERVCHVNNLRLPKRARGLCRLGVPWPKPWPDDPDTAAVKGTTQGWAYNCYVNEKVETYFVPPLQKQLTENYHHLLFGNNHSSSTNQKKKA